MGHLLERAALERCGVLMNEGDIPLLPNAARARAPLEAASIPHSNPKGDESGAGGMIVFECARWTR